MCEYYAFLIVAVLCEYGYEAYYAGGCVRDYLMGAPYADIDIASSAKPEDVQRIFRRTVAVGERFGVVIVVMGNVSFEVASFRLDGLYADGRRPESVSFATAREDAMRRDFTINGMFYDPLKETLIDYVGGKRDIREKLLRAIGDPLARFTEDKLRILRAIRFAARFGFVIESATWRALCRLGNAVCEVSAERIRDELLKIFARGTDRVRAMRLFWDSGLLQEVLPELARLREIPPAPGAENFYEATLSMLECLDDDASELLFAVLFFYVYRCGDSGVARRISKRFRLPARVGRVIADLLRCAVDFDAVFEMSLSRLKRFLRKSDFFLHLALYKVFCLSCGRDLDVYFYCLAKLHEWRDDLYPKLLLDGYDLLALGFPQGPLFQRILYDLEDAQLENRVSSVNEALEFVKMYDLSL